MKQAKPKKGDIVAIYTTPRSETQITPGLKTTISVHKYRGTAELIRLVEGSIWTAKVFERNEKGKALKVIPITTVNIINPNTGYIEYIQCYAPSNFNDRWTRAQEK